MMAPALTSINVRESLESRVDTLYKGNYFKDNKIYENSNS